MAIVSDVVRNSAYPASEFDREKKRHLDTLAQQEKNANAVGARVRSMLAFGPDHPYGHPAQGLPSTITAITRDDLARFHDTYWKPGSSALVVSGDVTLAEATALATKYFGSWTGGSAPAVDDPAAVARSRREGLRRGPPGRGADLRDAVPAGAASGRRPTTTRSRSPTRSSAGAGSARA